MTGKICLETVMFLWSFCFLCSSIYLLSFRVRLWYLDLHPEKRRKCPIYYVQKYVGNWKYEPVLVCSTEKYYHLNKSWVPLAIFSSLWLASFIFFLVLVCDKGTNAWFIYGQK